VRLFILWILVVACARGCVRVGGWCNSFHLSFVVCRFHFHFRCSVCSEGVCRAWVVVSLTVVLDMGRGIAGSCLHRFVFFLVVCLIRLQRGGVLELHGSVRCRRVSHALIHVYKSVDRRFVSSRCCARCLSRSVL